MSAGQTVTLSGDVMAQFAQRGNASPKKWTLWHAENEGRGGIVSYQYKQTSFINSLQWAIGLEIFLLSNDPWRLFFTTDHPNGAPFTRYPELLHLLMDYDYRMACLTSLYPDLAQMTLLPGLKREHSLSEVAIMTRAAPARILRQTNRGHLMPGAKADIAVYEEQTDKTLMFRQAKQAFKNGIQVVKKGDLISHTSGQTLAVNMGYDRQIEKPIQRYFDQFFGSSIHHYGVTPDVAVSQTDRFSYHRL